MASGTPVPIETIRELYESGRSGVRIAGELGVSKQTVYERLRRSGIEYRIRERKKPVIPKAELERMYLSESLTIAEIARRLGASWSIVANSLDVYGIQRRNNRPKKSLSWLQSLRVGEQIEIETDGRHPFYVYADARKLNIRVVVRRISERRFAIIRTPILEKDLVRALRNTGLSVREIAFTFRVDEKRIRRLLSQSPEPEERSA